MSLPVTGIVLHFRTPDVTAACLASLAAGGAAGVVVVDNSEDDGRSWAQVRPPDAPGFRIELCRPARNLGFAAGVNAALAHVPDGQHVLLLNSDARLDPGALARMVEQATDGDVVVPAVANDGDGTAGVALHRYQRTFGLYVRRHWPLSHVYPSGACLLLGRRLRHERLLDEDFFFYGEDVLLGERLRRRGARMLPCPDAVVRHAVSRSAVNGSLFYEYHMNRAHLLLASRLARSRAGSLVNLAGRLLVLPARAAVRAVRTGHFAAARGLLMAAVDVVRGRCRDLTPPAR